jgi:hypothetical protein
MFSAMVTRSWNYLKGAASFLEKLTSGLRSSLCHESLNLIAEDNGDFQFVTNDKLPICRAE